MHFGCHLYTLRLLAILRQVLKYNEMYHKWSIFTTEELTTIGSKECRGKLGGHRLDPVFMKI